MANKIKPARAVKNRIETVKETLEPYELIISTDTEQIAYKKSNNEVAYMANEKNVQEKLVSGVNLKTVGMQSLLGSGNISIPSTDEFATKVELNGKLDKNTTTSIDIQTYVKLADGTQSMAALSSGSTSFSIPFREANGLFNVGDAISPYHPIPMGQADNRYVKGNISIEDGTDLNTIMESGFYRINDSYLNGPPETVKYSQMIVSRIGDTFMQTIYPYSTGNVWVRTGPIADINSGGGWKRLAWASEMNWTLIATNSTAGWDIISLPTGTKEVLITAGGYTTVHLPNINNAQGISIQAWAVETVKTGAIWRATGTTIVKSWDTGTTPNTQIYSIYGR